MRVLKKFVLFIIGGGCYTALELLWRGWSHISMFLAGGGCFLLLGKIGSRKMPLYLRALSGAGAITAVELLAGITANRDYKVWDYRNTPMNFKGQICLPFSLLWMPVGLVGMWLYKLLDRMLKSA